MATSYPSKTLTILDVPEVQKFRASFRYNFFVPDEKSNDSGDHRLHGHSSTELNYSLRKRVPRWIEFSFDPVDIRTNASVDNEFVSKLSNFDDVEKLLIDNLSKIQKEVDVASKGYSTLNLQDRSIEYKSSKLISLSMRTRYKSLRDDESYDGPKWSFTRANTAKLLNELTGDYVAGRWIVQAMGSIRTRSVYSWYTRHSRRRRTYKPPYLKSFKNIKQYNQISDKFLYDIFIKSVADATAPFMNELSYKLDAASNVQLKARSEGEPGVISDYEYEPNIIPISIDRVEPGTFTSAVKIIGYIIDKQERKANHRYKNCDPIVVAGSSSSIAVDTKVKYGAYYSYSIRAIALCQMQAIDEETAQVYAVSGLVSSRSSRKHTVRCREYAPPPAPADLDFVWDYGNKKLMVMWSFPVVSQRDIKRFQVFKRRTVHNPFELQIEYDFDDSEIPDARSEMPRRSHVVEMNDPLTTYWDEEFTKESYAIYSLCSIDAHDFSSNYSAQFLVWFDETKNKLMKKIISPAGAPKPYPNFYLKEGADPLGGDINLTSDCMKDSGHTSCKIFFDPEYLSITGENDDDIDLWTTKAEGGSYKLQVINTDRQKSQIIDIEIDDLRTGK
jgi:hypothetical protein